jgi:hypothetical protein
MTMTIRPSDADAGMLDRFVERIPDAGVAFVDEDLRHPSTGKLVSQTPVCGEESPKTAPYSGARGTDGSVPPLRPSGPREVSQNDARTQGQAIAHTADWGLS